MSESKTPIVHLHIPKTAGTSLRSLFIGHYGAANVLCYYQTTGKIIRASDRLVARESYGADALKARIHARQSYKAAKALYRFGVARVEASFAFDPEELPDKAFKVLTGHLDVKCVVPNVSPDSQVMSLVREPMSRAYSHYMHWRRTQGDATLMGEPIPFDGDMTFQEYALMPQQQNYQSSILSALGRDCILGLSENPRPILENLGVDIGEFPYLNVNPDSNFSYKYKDRGFRRDFSSYHEDDMRLHDELCDREGLMVYSP